MGIYVYYRDKIPKFLKNTGKTISYIGVGLNLIENGNAAMKTKTFGFGNAVDIAITLASFSGGGAVIGGVYLVTDYVVYRYTGTPVREHLNNNVFSISW